MFISYRFVMYISYLPTFFNLKNPFILTPCRVSLPQHLSMVLLDEYLQAATFFLPSASRWRCRIFEYVEMFFHTFLMVLAGF